jgi:deoxyhypusine synthase
MSSIKDFITKHYRHYNAAVVVEAARAYDEQLMAGRQMMITLAGAMSTAELGVSLAEMIRQDKVHAITCTGANLEEDVFNLVAHDHYQRVPNWRNLRPEDEKDLESRGLNRVTDTCIPEDKAFRAIEHPMLALWQEADRAGQRRLPHEYIYDLVLDRLDASTFQINPDDSWIIAAAEKNLPLFVPGWEDSTLGNIFVSHVISGDLSTTDPVRPGTDYMRELAKWYYMQTMGRDLDESAREAARSDEQHVEAVPIDAAPGAVGFFQIGGGIAGDFPICVVPMIHQDLRLPCPYWSYFCQISEATTSYGGYSGAIPSEKITWGKLDADTPMFVIESDATIVAPLIFAYLLDL